MKTPDFLPFPQPDRLSSLMISCSLSFHPEPDGQNQPTACLSLIKLSGSSLEVSYPQTLNDTITFLAPLSSPEVRFKEPRIDLNKTISTCSFAVSFDQDVFLAHYSVQVSNNGSVRFPILFHCVFILILSQTDVWHFQLWPQLLSGTERRWKRDWIAVSSSCKILERKKTQNKLTQKPQTESKDSDLV